MLISTHLRASSRVFRISQQQPLVRDTVTWLVVHHPQVQFERANQRVSQHLLSVQHLDLHQPVKHLVGETPEVEEQHVVEVRTVCALLGAGLVPLAATQNLGDRVQTTPDQLAGLVDVDSDLEVGGLLREGPT